MREKTSQQRSYVSPKFYIFTQGHSILPIHFMDVNFFRL